MDRTLIGCSLSLQRKHTVGFKCPSASACRNLWRSAVEQRLFYTMSNSSKHGMVVTGGSFFSRGSRFRYQGRCEKEVIEESTSIARDPPEVKRIPLKSVGRSTSLPTTPADSDNYESVMSRVHRPLPYIDRSTSLDEEVLCDAESPSPTRDLYANGSYNAPSGAYCPESTLPPLSQLEPLSEDTENKYHESGISDIKYGDTDMRNGLEYYERPSQPYSPIEKPKEPHRIRDSSDPSKRLYRHPAIKEEDFLPSQIFCDCNDPRPDYEREDSSSSETLGPPTEPLDVPFTHKDTGLSFAQHPINQKPQSTMPRERPRADLTPTPPKPLKQSEQPSFSRKTSKLSSIASSVFRFSRVFLTTFILVVLTLGIFVLVVLETELSYFGRLRNSREMVLLRVQYYEPLKSFLFKNIK